MRTCVYVYACAVRVLCVCVCVCALIVCVCVRVLYVCCTCSCAAYVRYVIIPLEHFPKTNTLGGSRDRNHFSTLRYPLPAARSQVSTSHGQGGDCALPGVLRSTRQQHRFPRPTDKQENARVSILKSPASISRPATGVLVPWTRRVLLPHPPQQLQVPTYDSVITGLRIPRTGWILNPHPLQRLQPPSFGGCGAGRLLPGAAIFPCPGDHRDGVEAVAQTKPIALAVDQRARSTVDVREEHPS